MQNSKFKIQNTLIAFCIFSFAFFIATTGGCSIPSLESTACSEARLTAKQFYSFHFVNDMRPSPEYREVRRKYLTSELDRWLSEETEWQAVDAFTGVQNDDPRGYPKSFRIGRCVSGDSDPENDVFLQVQLFWIREETARQDAVQAERTLEMVRGTDQWLIATTSDGFRR